MSRYKIQQGINLHQKGQLIEANIIYEEILKNDKNNSEALHLSGVIYYQQQRYSEAKELLLKAISIKKDEKILNNYANCLKAEGNYKESLEYYDYAINHNRNYLTAYINKAELLKEINRFEDALKIYNELLLKSKNYIILKNTGIIYQLLNNEEKALKYYYESLEYNNDTNEVYYNIGVIKYKNNEIIEAEKYFEKACQINNTHKEANLNIGIIKYKTNRIKEAFEIFNKLIAIYPNYKEAYLNRGNILKYEGQYEKAIKDYDKALDIDIKYEDAYINKANIFKEINLYTDALANYDAAIKINCNNSITYSNKGTVYQELRDYKAAIENYELAIKLNENNSEAYLNMGNAFKALNNNELAIKNYNKAISIKQDLAEAYSNKGNILMSLKKYKEAIYNYDLAFKLKPNIINLISNIIYLKLIICDWNEYDKLVELYNKYLTEDKYLNSPFLGLLINDNVEVQYKSSELYSQKRFKYLNKKENQNIEKVDNKIKIAYFSADLYYHPVCIWLAELLENHNKNEFEIYIFSLSQVSNDSMNKRIRNSSDYYFDVGNISDLEVIAIGKKLGIHIAIDLNGYTENSRSGIFAGRVAPIQINFIGYPATSGSDFMDYFISDYISIEEKQKKYFSERIAFIPCAYTYDSNRITLEEGSLTRKSLGIEDDHFVFTCQNGNHKINPEVFKCWVDILNTVPKSILWLMKSNEIAMENLLNYAYLCGIEKNRIIFTSRKKVSDIEENKRVNEYITDYQVADLFLDTWPYNAGTTALDALRAGLPILTKKGSTFVSRLASAALETIETPELIATSIEEYKRIAIELALNQKKYRELKLKVKHKTISTNLFKPEINTKHIEKAYVSMVKRKIKNLPNVDIYIN